MVDLILTISITTLKFSGLNTPIKDKLFSEWIKKLDPMICFLQETHF